MTANTSPVLMAHRSGAAVVLAIILATGALHGEEPRRGEAVVVNKVGNAQAYLIDGPVHEGRLRRSDLVENSSIGETARLATGRDGRLCMVLSPGAVLCVAPDSELTFQQLRLAANGLPQREEDLIRRIHINLIKGRILVHAGAPIASLDIRIKTDTGEVHADGGTFAVARQSDGTWAVFNDEFEQTLVPEKGTPLPLKDKQTAVMTRQTDGTAEARLDASLGDSPLRQFEVCNVFFEDLEPFLDDPVRFDRQGLSSYIGGADAAIDFIGGDIAAVDVSPSFRPIPVANVRPGADMGKEASGGGRWGQQRIWDWYNNIGPVKGFNYVPRYAVNSTEMWMEETFDPEIIDQELGWAKNADYTAVRVQLQAEVWRYDPDGFLERVQKFLELADRNGLRVVPILFDDLNLAGAEPVVGPQPNPAPDAHNSRWTPSPGPSKVVNRTEWGQLEAYVKTVMQKFRSDDRVLFWDLYNMAGAGSLGESSLPLLEQTFNWARATDAEQPLAVAAWTRPGSAMTAHKLERSDLVTFQSFDAPQQLEALLVRLKKQNRPVICTDWLMRQNGNNFESLLPVFSVHRVGWFNRGLVNGRTQTWLQQPQFRSEKDPDVWQHDVFRANGEAFSKQEVEQIKAFRFTETPI